MKIAWMHQHKVFKNTLKRLKKTNYRSLQASNSNDSKQKNNKNEKKTTMDISSDKQVILPSRRREYGLEKNLKRGTEALLMAAQVKIDNKQQNIKCRLCGNRDETVNHTINEHGKLSQMSIRLVMIG